MRAEHRQEGFDVRLEWGPVGAETLSGAAYAVVVDVLSATTATTVATERGIAVHPFRWRDERAQVYADSVGAVLAGRRGTTVSLSPAALARVSGVERVVLPSPNGSTISAALADSGSTVVAAGLRNAPAVAQWLVRRGDGEVAVVPAGDRWPDGTLRPAAAAFAAARLPGDLAECAGGRQLIARGFAEDVSIAGEYGASDAVPVLAGGAFVAGHLTL